MLNFVDSDKSEFGIKLSCMMEILYSGGLRVTELVSLPLAAIQKEEGNKLRNYLIVKGKGSKERIVPLGKAALVKLAQYLQLRKEIGYENSKWLFVGKTRSSKKFDSDKYYGIWCMKLSQ